ELAAQLLSGVKQGLVAFALENDLGEAIAVAQVDEDLIGERPVDVDPTVENDGLADVALSQFPASNCPLPTRHEIASTACQPSRSLPGQASSAILSGII